MSYISIKLYFYIFWNIESPVVDVTSGIGFVTERPVDRRSIWARNVGSKVDRPEMALVEAEDQLSFRTELHRTAHVHLSVCQWVFNVVFFSRLDNVISLHASKLFSWSHYTMRRWIQLKIMITGSRSSCMRIKRFLRHPCSFKWLDVDDVLIIIN